MIVCVCRRVSDRDIERAVRAGAASFEEVQFETGAGTCCGRCGDCARALVERGMTTRHAGAVRHAEPSRATA